MKNVLSKLLGPLGGPFFVIQEVFESIDVNQDGTIEFEEFLHVRFFFNSFMIFNILSRYLTIQ